MQRVEGLKKARFSLDPGVTKDLELELPCELWRLLAGLGSAVLVSARLQPLHTVQLVLAGLG